MAGSPLLSPALILGSIRYGETSRIVRLSTRDFGLLSAMAKGALRPKSRFGASLRLLSEGQAHLILAGNRDLHLLTAFDLVTPHAALAGDLGRFLTGTALAELAVSFVPAGPNPAIHALLVQAIHLLESAPTDQVPALGIRVLWLFIGELGVAPTLEWCARDGNPVAPEGGAVFSLEEGGLLCGACAAEVHSSTRLAAEDVASLTALLADGADLPELDEAHLAAHRRLLVRWVRYHLGDAPLPALEFWRKGVSP